MTNMRGGCEAIVGEEKENLWEQAANLCLSKAIQAIERETTPTSDTVEVVKGLVDIAIQSICSISDGRSKTDPARGLGRVLFRNGKKQKIFPELDIRHLFDTADATRDSA